MVSVEKYALGGFADIRRGQFVGQSVRIKSFRVKAARNTELTEHVRTLTISEEADSDTLLNRGSTLTLYD